MKKIRFDKKGVVGVTIATIVGTIAIVLLLSIFIISSGLIKSLGKAGAGDIGIMEENNVGLNDVISYVIVDFKTSMENRFNFERRGELTLPSLEAIDE